MRLRRRHLLIAAVLVLVAATAGSVTWAAFTATTTGDGARVVAGSVAISDNDAGTALLALTGATPGTSDTGCIRVRYQGTLPATVRMYGTTSGTGLDKYLNLTITRGAYSPSEPAFDSCTNFQADSTNYIGAGAGVIYDGTLEDFPDDWASGHVDATSGSLEVWDTNEIHVYRIRVALQNNIAAEGLTATQTFTWDARSQ